MYAVNNVGRKRKPKKVRREISEERYIENETMRLFAKVWYIWIKLCAAINFVSGVYGFVSALYMDWTDQTKYKLFYFSDSLILHTCLWSTVDITFAITLYWGIQTYNKKGMLVFTFGKVLVLIVNSMNVGFESSEKGINGKPVSFWSVQNWFEINLAVGFIMFSDRGYYSAY